MKSVDLTAGTIEYREQGDPNGAPVVLLHGLLMNDAQWNLALPLLPQGYRFLLPILPMGGHRIPMRDDADLTLPGMVDIVGDFLDALDLADVTLVVTGWGGALFLTDIGRDKRVARLVICPSGAFDNFPPGFPGKVAWLAAGLADRRIRQDLVKYCRTKFDKADLIRATNRLADFDGHVLVLWSRNPVMPDHHATQLAELTGGTLRYIDDANVLVMLDQPEQTALEIGAFLNC